MGLNNNNSVEKSGAKARRSIYNLVLIVVVGVLFVTGYTYILQKMYNDSILDNAIAEDSSRTDAMHKGVSNALTREDFTEINTVDDMNTLQIASDVSQSDTQYELDKILLYSKEKYRG